MLNDDLNEVFFNTEEFNIEIQHENEEDFISEPLIVIFDEKTEVILDSSSEFGDSASYVPSFLIPVLKGSNINSHSTFKIENENYGFSFKNKENIDELRVYLEKR